MKDYNKVAEKIRKMGCFCDIHQCGSPSENHPVNLYFLLCEAYCIGYGFYVAYSFGNWSIDYTLNPAVKMRTQMKHIAGIKTDKEMYQRVDDILKKIRTQCHTNQDAIKIEERTGEQEVKGDG